MRPCTGRCPGCWQAAVASITGLVAKENIVGVIAAAAVLAAMVYMLLRPYQEATRRTEV